MAGPAMPHMDVPPVDSRPKQGPGGPATHGQDIRAAVLEPVPAYDNEHDPATGPSLWKEEEGEKESPKVSLDDWLSIAANLEGGYRNTQFHRSGHNSTFFLWDSRVELWLPPSRRDFSWGPYIRLAGITSTTTETWENGWLARPGFGFQVYPFSIKALRDPSSIAGKVLGPIRVFYEYNYLHYWGGQEAWRPDRQILAGADYWKEINANNTEKAWWTEIWSGLMRQRVDEWNTHIDNVVFGAAARLGVRKPNAGILSMFTPYLLADSSLTENTAFWWENRMLLGAGIRLAPHRKHFPKWITRFVVFGEYVGAAYYYRHEAPSSTPDYDFRLGVNISVGEWFK
jgi:hypothetical protein